MVGQMKVRRFTLGVAAAAALVTLSACGSDDVSAGDGGSGGDQAAVGSNAAASLTQANFSETVLAAQRKVGSAHVEATVEFSGQEGSFSGDFSGEDLKSMEMDMAADIAGQQINLRLVDRTVYMKGAGLSTDPAKPWISIDLDDRNNPLASVLDSANPANVSAYLQGVTSLEDEGTETVDGVLTHHYSVTIDTADMLKANSMFKGQDTSQLDLPKQIVTDAWLNEDDVPVKVLVTIGDSGSFEAHFSDIGVPVTVEAPPAKQVVPFSL